MKKKVSLSLLVLMGLSVGGSFLFYGMHSRSSELVAAEYATSGYKYLIDNKIDLSEDAFLCALAAIEADSGCDLMLKTNIYLGLEQCSLKKNDWDKVIAYNKSALAILSIMIDMPRYKMTRATKLKNLYVSYNRIMHGYFETGRYGEARKHFSEVERYRNREKPHPELAKIYVGLAKNMLMTKDYKLTNKCCDNGIHVCTLGKSQEYNPVMALLLWVKADGYYQNNDLPNAIKCAQDSLAFFKKDHDNEAYITVEKELKKWITVLH